MSVFDQDFGVITGLRAGGSSIAITAKASPLPIRQNLIG
jgi:hypothetical protein